MIKIISSILLGLMSIVAVMLITTIIIAVLEIMSGIPFSIISMA